METPELLDITTMSEAEKEEEASHLLEELSDETLPFPSIDKEVYLKLKTQEEGFLEYITPLDEIIERCKTEGVRVVCTGKNPYPGGKLFVLPALSKDIYGDSILLHNLTSDGVENEHFKQLIELTKSYKKPQTP